MQIEESNVNISYFLFPKYLIYRNIIFIVITFTYTYIRVMKFISDHQPHITSNE